MFIDSHTHLLRLKISPEEAVERASDAGVSAVVNIGTSIEDSQTGLELAAVIPNVYSAAGIHPHNAGTYVAPDLEALAEMSESPGVVALGEVGLDYFRGDWSREIQQALFEDAISLANDTRLPLIIHSRKAYEDTLSCLDRAQVPVVLHCFEGGETEVRAAAERGYFIGLAGNVTFKNNPTVDFIHLIDHDRLLIETDAPYLSPEPLRGKPNEPANVVHAARFVAGKLGVSPEDLAARTTKNACDLFGLPASQPARPVSPGDGS